MWRVCKGQRNANGYEFHHQPPASPTGARSTSTSPHFTGLSPPRMKGRGEIASLLHDSMPDAQRGGARDGLLGFCAPHPARGGDDEGDFALQAWCRSQPSSNLMDELASAPVNIASADGSCDSFMTVASALSSNATLAAAASSDVGDDASCFGLEVDSGAGSTPRTDTDDHATPRRHSHPHILSAGIKRGSSAIQKTRAKKAPAPESRSSGVPDNWMPSFLPLGMMAAALSKDLAERKLLAQHKKRTKVKKEAGTSRGRL